MQPIVLSILTCGRVIFDKMTGLASIVDIVSNINAPKFPIRQNICFFCELTNGHGKCSVKLKVVKSDETDKVLFEQERPLEFKDVKQIVSFAANLQGCPFPEPGEYRFQLFADSKFLAERRILCRKVELPSGGKQG